jgi:hypothetical protein
MTLGTLYSDMFRYDEGKQWYQKAIAAGERLGDRVFTAVAYYNLSILETRFNRFDLALEAANASLDAQNRASGRLARGEIFLRQLDFPRALADYENAYEIDTSPLAKINLAQICQITGRLEEARLYAEDCLKAGDLSWMLNFGIDPVRYRRDIRDILYKTYAGLAETEKLTAYSGPGEKIRSLFRRASRRFRAAVNRHLYRKYSLSAGDAYGTEAYEEGPHLDSFIQYYNAFEGYPRRAAAYLNRARDFETALIPAMKPSYDLEEGTLLKKPGLVNAALTGFDPLWEREMIAKCWLELAKQEKGAAKTSAAEQLYALNRGALRQRGVKLPVELRISVSGGPNGGGRLAKRLGRALQNSGFAPSGRAGQPDPSRRYTLTISLDPAETGDPGAAGLRARAELYDRETGNAPLRRTLALESTAAADLCAFAREIAALAFTE